MESNHLARDVARHTTSNVAAGEWSPFSVDDPAVSSDEFKSKLNWAARISHHAYTNLGGADYGIRWLETYVLNDSVDPADEDALFNDLFRTGDVRAWRTSIHDPLRTPVRDDADRSRGMCSCLQAFWISGFNPHLQDRSDVLSLDESVIFNCSGLGAAIVRRRVVGAGQRTARLLPARPGCGLHDDWRRTGPAAHVPALDVILLGGMFKLGDTRRM